MLTDEQERAEQEERRIKAIELKRRSYPWHYIAGQLGYTSPQHAAQDVLTALERRRKENARQLDAYVQLELEKLDALERLMMRITGSRHILVQQGRVMINPVTQELMEDNMPYMQATDRLLRIAERRAKLLGLDSAVKVDMRVSEETDMKIEQLLAELAPKEVHGERRLEILAAAGTAGIAEETPGPEEPEDSESQR